MRLSALLALAAIALPSSAAEAAQDPYSYAEPDKVRVRHADLDLALDFPARTIAGTVTLELDWREARADMPAVGTLSLDTRDLTIERVEALDDAGHAQALRYTLAAPDAELGSRLGIAAPGQPARVRIAYRTAPTASGLQWLDRQQTADKQAPFLFSQSQSIHARSWIPLQDTPAVRFSYAARVRATQGITVLMSALRQPAQGEVQGFSQPQPIPSYLMAIAAGALAEQATSKRTAVWAEPSQVAAAAREFSDIEAMMRTTEQLYGPYRWGRYDMLVLPPSFPFGGMENPEMTFLTPTVIAGDKSLVSVVAHELAHSWSGNLVTSATWRDIWLNEGFTTYVENRIVEAVYGRTQADEEFVVAAGELRHKMQSLSENQQRLAPVPREVGADDALTDVAYVKGAWFLRFLEARFGRVVFDAYLRDYFDHYAFQSITTEQMLDYLRANLVDRHPGKVDWDQVEQWVYAPGLPESATLPAVPAFTAIDTARAAFLHGTLGAAALPGGDWNTHEWLYFLDHLPEAPTLVQVQALDAAWRLARSSNAEIGMRWLPRAIRAGDSSAWPAARAYMLRIGRMKLTLPVYRAFASTPAGLAYAETAYAAHQAEYHPLTRQAIEKVLRKAHAQPEATP
ncbi:MAG: M1 family metallopeptidase [Pseudomonadota bacterium]|nr:M1 family metallopeptidase [Pseudomonadota bacterium]